MQPQVYFFLSIALSFIAWGIVTARYIWPELRPRPRAEGLRPVLMLHGFRFIGLAFLVPGVVSPDLPSAFAHSAAYGDMVARDPCLAFAAISAQCGWLGRGLDLQSLGHGRYPERFLPGQSRRSPGRAVGSRILPSDFGSTAAADYPRTRVPDSSGRSTGSFATKQQARSLRIFGQTGRRRTASWLWLAPDSQRPPPVALRRSHIGLSVQALTRSVSRA